MPKKLALVTVGADPGLRGGVAVLINGEFGELYPSPIETTSTGRHRIDAASLYDVFVDIDHRFEGSRLVAIESVSAMPKQGVSGMFSLGDSFGCLRMGATLLGARTEFIIPGVWKRYARLLKKSKGASLASARRLFPAARPKLLAGPRGGITAVEGVAEALLIAHFAYQTFQR